MLKSMLLVGSVGIGSLYWQQRWRYIVIHHSAGAFGDIAFLQEVHRQRQAQDPIDAIPYHYVNGNGNGLGMGEIANDSRGELHIWGAHVSGNNTDRNFRGIGICLIGNYDVTTVPEPQYLALVGLTRTLMSRYAILPGNVAGHGRIAGEATRCPGKFFPMQRFMRDIS
ncbi:peptidoglycan recognition protein family protein [Exilibacterium tricleocarpae]|nr:peptidoglycan recognition family protein [Exilibacterium tricleocarpae]